MLKRIIKKIPFIFYLLQIIAKAIKKKHYKSYVSYNNTEITTIASKGNIFVGYFDVNPFNFENSNLIVFHKNNLNPNKKPSTQIKTEILLYNTKNKKSTTIDFSYAWNWQQGTRLQWLDAKTLIYNSYENEKLFAKTYNIQTRIYTHLPVTINAVYKNKFALTLDYVSLSEYSEYGYPGIHNSNKIDGIIYYDFITKKQSVLLEEKEINNLIEGILLKKIKNNHINHLSIAPDGQSFIFIYRGVLKTKRVDFLFHYKFRNSHLKLLISNNIISHYTWKSNNEFIMWAVIKGISGYYLVNTINKKHHLIFNTHFDGHPNMIGDNNILTDTYPDRNSNQHLYLYNFQKNELIKILSIYHPILYSKQTRCDLHPSVSHDLKTFQIDSRHKNKRQILVGRLPNFS